MCVLFQGVQTNLLRYFEFHDAVQTLLVPCIKFPQFLLITDLPLLDLPESLVDSLLNPVANGNRVNLLSSIKYFKS